MESILAQILHFAVGKGFEILPEQESEAEGAEWIPLEPPHSK